MSINVAADSADECTLLLCLAIRLCMRAAACAQHSMLYTCCCIHIRIFRAMHDVPNKHLFCCNFSALFPPLLQLIARPAGPATTTANAAVRATTPAPRTGRHLMQANRGNAGRSTASGNTASASIKQAVQAANRGGRAPGATQQATRTGQQAAQLIARPAGLPATTTGKIVTTRPAQNNPRGM
jgi:hypothetical protein